jgi:serine/threonine-protein kinase
MTIRDTYEVERLLGEGAFAEVYRVKHRFLGRQAMKVFKRPGMTLDEIAEWLGEALLLSRFGHPNLIRVFEANLVETRRGTCGFFTMEHLAGGTLDQFWRAHGLNLVPVETALDIARQICRGLAVAHAETPPIIHRDVKPHNVLVNPEPSGKLRVCLSDFGLARRANPLTLLATVQGTRCYKAPETLVNFHSDSCAGDVWALGCTLYLLLTDRFPYQDEGAADDLTRKRYERLIPASQFNVQVDAELDRVLGRALAVPPRDRYPDAAALLADLERWTPRAAPVKPAARPAESVPEGAAEAQARQLALQAFQVAERDGKLSDATRLLEAAFRKYPALREQYGYRLDLWRRGVAM